MVARGPLGERPRGLAPLLIERLLGGPGGDQGVAARADQVVASGLFEGPSDLEVVLGLEELEQRPLHPPVAEPLGDRHRLLRHWVEARVVHAGGDVEGAGNEVLHLVGLVAVPLEKHGEVNHLLQSAAGVAGDKIRHRVLLLANAATRSLELPVERDVVVSRGLFHQPQHFGVGVLRRHLQMAADVVLGEFLKVFGVAAGEIHPHATGDEHPLHALHAPCLPHQFLEGAVVGAEQFADRRMHAREPAALGLDVRPGASHLIHVGRRPADVRHRALEARLGGKQLDLGDDRVLRAALDDPSFMGRDRAEGAAAEAASHDLHAVFYHLKRGNPSVAVGGMRPSGEVQAIHLIHLVLLEGQGRRIDDDCLAAVSLHEPPRVVGIGLEV